MDAGPLGMASNPRSSPENDGCKQWVYELVAKGATVCIPEIADYEIRRELLRADKQAGLLRLDALRSALQYVAITTEAMLVAARFWAEARQRGQATAPTEALDGDVILAAQAVTAGFPLDEIVVATTNVGHLSRFVPAALWTSLLRPADEQIEDDP